MSERGHEIFGIDRRKAILTGVAALVLAVAAVAGIGQVTSLHHVVRALGRGNHAWFPVCLAGALLAYAGYVAAYRDVLASTVDPGLVLADDVANRRDRLRRRPHRLFGRHARHRLLGAPPCG